MSSGVDASFTPAPAATVPTTRAVADTPTWDRDPDAVDVAVTPADVEILADLDITTPEDAGLAADARVWTADAVDPSEPEPAESLVGEPELADDADLEPVASFEISPIADSVSVVEAEDVQLVEREIAVEPVRRPATDIWVADDPEQCGSRNGHAEVEISADAGDRGVDMTDADTPSGELVPDAELNSEESDDHGYDASVPEADEPAPAPDPVASAERFARDLAATYAELDAARDAARAASAAKRAAPRQPGDKTPDVTVLSGPLADV